MALLTDPRSVELAKTKGSFPLRLALTDYDRARPIIDGSVKPDNIALSTDVVWIEHVCKRPVYEEYDVAEMSFSWFVAAICRGEPVVALPIFPLRMSVLNHIFVREDSPYRVPADLAGKRIGVPAYRLTINLWLRGILRDHYGLDTQQLDWISSEPEGAGYDPPTGTRLTFDPNATAEERLWRGEVDAVFLPRPPDAIRKSLGGLRRLFSEPQAESQRFVRRTGIYPITHIMVMNATLNRREPWIAGNLTKAFLDAQRKCEAHYWEMDVRLPYPDAAIFLEQQLVAYGPDPCEQGLTSANCRVLETFVQYAYEQNYMARRPALDELFVSVR